MFENVIDKKLTFYGAKMKFNKELQYIILHHTAASADQTVNQIHSYHLNKGWIGIGYNILVDKYGNTYWGRGIEYRGAHTKGYNDISIGICAIGNMETGIMPEAQKESIKKTIKEVLQYYPSITKIVGHKDLAATLCPGKNYPLSEMKALINDSPSVGDQSPSSGSSDLLKEGQKGSKITELQEKLKSIGYDPQGIDGIFGPKTKAALVAFQTAMGIDTDAIVGPITAGALKEVLAKPTIKNGSKGYVVRQLQTMLKKKGFDPKGVDGIFGSNTEAAVKKFQTAKKILIDGIVGPQTWSAIY